MSELLKSLTFYLEIRLDGQPQEEAFQETIEQLGGRVLKRLQNTVSHVIWVNGRLQTLAKAKEMGMKIVSPLWLEACITKNRLVPEDQFRPSNMEARIRNAQGKNPKKRAVPDSGQLTLLERPVEGVSQNELEDCSEERMALTIAYIERIRNQRRDEQYFQREFAKERKRLNKNDDSL